MSGSCQYPTTDAEECYGNAKAAIGLTKEYTTATGSDSTKPVGCSASMTKSGGRIEIYFNSGAGGSACGATKNVLGGAVDSVTSIEVQVSARWPCQESRLQSWLN